jgi:hypothetical protein
MENKSYNLQDNPGSFNTPPTPNTPYTPPPPPPPAAGSSQFSHTGGQNQGVNHQVISQMVKNMKFVGIWNIIIGVINCLTCIGALVGVPIIFAGLRLRQSAESFATFSQSGMTDQNSLLTALEKQSRFFFIFKVLIIVGIILVIIEILVLIVMFIFMPTTTRNFYNL